MGARITTRKKEYGIRDKFRKVLVSIRCDECGAEVPSRFADRCPSCGEKFDETIEELEGE